MTALLALPMHFELKEAKRVLQLEAEALKALSDTLDRTFARATQIMHDTQGRVIITGMGKSGHVARKIAATLASTGTPSLFIHPAEASHGDLGMISPKDSIVMLSVTGETSELSDMIEHSRILSLPLIAITQDSQSTLAKIATVTLLLPRIEEACAIGLAPTTSTTMMMALGDALATTLMKYQGFSPEDFGVLHPGGKLGQRLKRVQDIMHTGERVPLAPLSISMKEALLIMTSKRFGCVGLTNEKGGLVGIITDGDLRRHMSSNLLELSATDVMTAHPLTIEGHILAQEALVRLNELQRTNFFVVDRRDDQKIPVGIVHIHDFIRANFVQKDNT